MKIAPQKTIYYPINYPMNFSGKLSSKIIIKDDYIRSDGTCSLYLQIFLSSNRKRIPLNIMIPPLYFDKIKQRVRLKHEMARDYNLLIEKALADINLIEVNYRLSNETLTIEKLMHEYLNPSSRIDFIKMWESELEIQKQFCNLSTYKQQKSILKKVKTYCNSIMFYEIDKLFYEKMIRHFKTVEKNSPHTLQTLAKNFKKYLHIANNRGIKTPMNYKEIKTPKCISNRTFLEGHEIIKLNQYYNSDFINENLKNILARFLFSCFTGLRISDILKLSPLNIIGDVLVFTANKTGKLQQIRLNDSAKKYIDPTFIFKGNYTEQHINRELKYIMKTCGINKNVSFHVARHTFATNFLICGGSVEVLQLLLAHSNIRETMDYVHIVRNVTNEQINKMDSILNPKKPLE